MPLPARNNIPSHIAIIPDGNRRWAKRHFLQIPDGYARGVEKFREIAAAAFEKGILNLTFWAASEDNLTKRSPAEIKLLVKLLKRELTDRNLGEEMAKRNTKISFVGRWNDILKDKVLEKEIRAAEEKTGNFKSRALTILFGYDGKREMLEAVKTIQKSSSEDPRFEMISRALWTGNLPPVDLVIRTGEEKPGWTHWSAGFMMWQAADAVFYSTKNFWPDFSADELSQTIKNFAARERRFGT